jgi:hypothetical protein
MIDCFGEQYNYEIIRYRDDKSKMVYDVYGDADPEDRFYPDDLENLIYYIRSNAKASMNRLYAGNDVPAQTYSSNLPKTSAFSSFASKGLSSFAQKKA